MGLSLGGFSYGAGSTPAITFGRQPLGELTNVPQEPNGKTDPPSKKSPRHDSLQQKQSNAQVAHKAALTRQAEQLERIKAESYAHIMGHERAHQSAAGGLGGGIVINYDSNGIAIAGHVPISIPGLDSANPESRLRDYAAIRGAALAPGDPSGQDMAVAAMAQALIGMAQLLINQKQLQEKQTGKTPRQPTTAETVNPSGQS